MEEGCFPLRAATKKKGVFWGAFLPVFWLREGPPQFEMCDMEVLDTKERGGHHRDNAHKLLLWEEQSIDKGKWGASGFSPIG